MAVTNAKEAEAIYKQHNVGRYGWLGSRSNRAYIAFAHAIETGELKPAHLVQLGNHLKALDSGTAEDRARAKADFATLLKEAEERMQRRGVPHAFNTLLSLTRLRHEYGDLEQAKFEAGGGIFDRAAQLIDAAPEELRGRRDQTVMFRLEDLRRQEALGDDRLQTPAQDLDELEAQLREAGSIMNIPKRLLRFLGRPVTALGRKLKEAAPHSPTVQRAKPYLSRLMQLLSRDKHTVIHAANAGISPQHVTLQFLPAAGLVQITDLHKPTDRRGTSIHPSSKASSVVPVQLQIPRGFQERLFPDADAHFRLVGTSGRIARGHAFDIRGNRFLVSKLAENEVVLKGTGGSVEGRVFKFDPLRQSVISIGSSLDNHIRLLSEKPVALTRRRR